MVLNRGRYNIMNAAKLLLLCIAVFFSGSGYAADFCFDFNRKTYLKPYPKELAYAVCQKQEGERKILVIRKTPGEKQAVTAYQNDLLPDGTGAAEFTFRYRLLPKSGSSMIKADMTIRFNGKGNRLIEYRIPLSVSPNWQKIRQIFEAPEGADSFQVVYALNGAPGELHLDQLSIECFRDKLTVPEHRQNLNQRPAKWSEAVELKGFQDSNTGTPAKIQTKVRLSYDTSCLYAGFIMEEPEMKSIKKRITVKDGDVWLDDCIEFFLFDPVRKKGWQFAVNADGVVFDAELKQRVPGDPFKADKSWNGNWSAMAFRNRDSWEIGLAIPFDTLGITEKDKTKLRVNFARERKVITEYSHWNAYAGRFQEVEKYAILEIGTGCGKLQRYRKTETTSFAVKRAKPQFSLLLENKPGNYAVGCWAHGMNLKDFPETVRRKYRKEDLQKWQVKLLKAWGEASMCNMPLPWASSVLFNGNETILEHFRRYGMKIPCFTQSSDTHRAALKHGAEYYWEKHVDPASEAYGKEVMETLKAISENRLLKENPSILGFLFGIDEPTNMPARIYSKTGNPAIRQALKSADQAVKENFGFGKYGLPDEYADPAPDQPFQRIAFWRFWNHNFAVNMARQQKFIREHWPEVPFFGVNRNTCAGISPLNVTTQTIHTDWIGCDPYPTSAAALFGISRALYHTGFSVKMLADLAPKSRIAVMPQCFVYHGRRPTPDNMREWASQALKNGAQVFHWYEAGPAIFEMPEGYLEMLRLNKQIAAMKKLKIPQQTHSAILYSEYDQWALDDKAGHGAYALYVILGEHLKSWFRFISPTGIAGGLHKLDDYRIVYVPRLRYVTPELSEKLITFVRKGGTLVILDPSAFLFNLDGSHSKARKEVFGFEEMGTPRTKTSSLYFGNIKLPLFPVYHIDEPEAGRVQAFDFTNLPEDARTVAFYPDGKKAIIERPAGKGKILLSAVLPFGNSDVIRKPGGWLDFFQNLIKQAGEPSGLPIWDFELPRLKEYEVSLEPLIK